MDTQGVDTEITEKDEKDGNSEKNNKSNSIKNKQKINFPEMKNLFDLLVSFSEANRHVLDIKKSNSSRLFARFTDLLENILETLDQIEIVVDERIVS